MKNLLIYIHPRKSFDKETDLFAKIQIDNSLNLGWKKEDILIVTNFPYEYNGVKALIVDDDNYCAHCPTATKINVIAEFFKHGVIDKEELYWAHDFDAHQSIVITETELDLDNGTIGVTDYGRMPKWNMGSIFFRGNSQDIFGWIKNIMYEHESTDERALWALTGNDTVSIRGNLIKALTPIDIPGIENINDRVKKMNISYNFLMFNVRSCYPIAIKPIRVGHFHLYRNRQLGFDPIDFYIRGKNKVGKVLMSERLINIFKDHGVE